MARRMIAGGSPATGTRALKMAGGVVLATALVVGCGSSTSSPGASSTSSAGANAQASAVASAQASATPSVTPVPIPSGWVKREVGDIFTIALPAEWIAITPAERDDATAAAALEAKYPQYKTRIEAGLAAMRKNEIPLMAFEPRETGFATNIVVPKGTNGTPLSLEYVQGAATGIKESLELATAPTIVEMTNPNGYRLTWKNEANGTAGVSYVIGSGEIVYAIVLTTAAERATTDSETGQQIAATMVIIP